MNSVQKGDLLEDEIFNLFKDLIDNEQFLVKKSNCKIFQKKGYYSKDREGNIIFDISIEMFLSDTDEYFMLMLIECKNYKHTVPVNDIEEFFAKVQQVGAANAKAVIASTNSFQQGTLKFAKSKGIGVLRYSDPQNYKWELRRHTSSTYWSSLTSNESIQEGLYNPNFKSKYFDLYMQSPSKCTNDLWVFIEDLIDKTIVTQFQIQGVINSKNCISVPIEFIEKPKQYMKVTSNTLSAPKNQQKTIKKNV